MSAAGRLLCPVEDLTPKLYFVHADHLNRPIKMTDGSKASVWDAVWLPFGGVHSITGTASNNARLPGQWYQLESDLHYNWHRHYDPMTGRYTSADPLGLEAGPSLYAYVLNSPQMYVDPEGKNPLAAIGAFCVRYPAICIKIARQCLKYGRQYFSEKPSTGQMAAARRILEKDGRNSLEKSRRSIQRQIQRHEQKIEDVKEHGGYVTFVNGSHRVIGPQKISKF